MSNKVALITGAPRESAAPSRLISPRNNGPWRSVLHCQSGLHAECAIRLVNDINAQNLKSSNMLVSYPGPKYKKTSFSNPGHAINLAKKLNTLFKTDHEYQIRGDATLRNFIQHKGQIWGVDFEESRVGKPGEDLATLCSSLLSTDPMFTDEKYKLCQVFLDTYRNTAPWTIKNIRADIAYALLEQHPIPTS